MNNFTPRAQEALGLARREADRLNHNFVGTEHVLLGLISLGRGVAVTVLQKLGIDLDRTREEVEKFVGRGPDQKIFGSIPYTPRVKRVMALAAKNAKSLHHTYVGTEHILLGLLEEGGGVAARVLKHFEVDIEQTRREILKELDPNFETAQKTIAIRHQEPPQDSIVEVQKTPEPIDTSKHYDVYCAERGQEVVYRNARFKGWSTLLPKGQHDFAAEFIELEQADGITLFIALTSIIKFCPHGQKPGPATA